MCRFARRSFANQLHRCDHDSRDVLDRLADLDRPADLERRGLIESTVFGSPTMVHSSFRGITVGVAGRDLDALGASLRREVLDGESGIASLHGLGCGLARLPADH